jgi:topoisomerase-4 subunit A
VIYRDGKNGSIMMKRCAITGITRDKEYTLTKGAEDSRILYFTANPNGEAEIVRITLRPRPRLKNLILDVDFGQLAIKGRDAQGNILTRYGIHKIVFKEKGVSTLGGQKIWYDDSVNRLNMEAKGTFLGEFKEADKIIEVTKSGTYRLASFDLSTHFEEDVLLVEKFNANKIYSAIYYDGEQKSYYLKRFIFEPTSNLSCFITEETGSKVVCISSMQHPRFQIKFGGAHKTRPVEVVVAEEFISVKGCKAKGKRLTTNVVSEIVEIEPAMPDEEPIDIDETEAGTTDYGIDSMDDKEPPQMLLELE